MPRKRSSVGWQAHNLVMADQLELRFGWAFSVMLGQPFARSTLASLARVRLAEEARPFAASRSQTRAKKIFNVEDTLRFLRSDKIIS